ncbi:MAG: hypothetical protein ACK55I_18600, partial [bacterium]
MARQRAQGAEQAGDRRASGGGVGLGATPEGADHGLGGGVDDGPLVARQGLDHRRGLVPQSLEAAHRGNGGAEIAGLQVALALGQQVDHRVDRRRQGGLASGGGGLHGGLAGGGGALLDRFAGLFGGVGGGLGAGGERQGAGGGQGQAGALQQSET